MDFFFDFFERFARFVLRFPPYENKRNDLCICNLLNIFVSLNALCQCLFRCKEFFAL